MSIKRYTPLSNGDMVHPVHNLGEGEYVLYADHLEAMAKAQAVVDAAEKAVSAGPEAEELSDRLDDLEEALTLYRKGVDQ